MTTSLPLVFDEPRRAKKPPRHLADLTGEERRTAVAALGEPAFRAKQLSNHYFSRLVSDPAEMTDLPAATRDKLVAELMPPLLTRVRDLECDNGETRKTLWKLLDGSLVESVLMRYPGRMWDGMPVLCDRPGRSDAQHDHRRGRRAGRRRCAGAVPR